MTVEIDPTGDARASLLVRHRMWVLVGIGLLMFVLSLGLRDFWYPDEPDIAEVAKVMYESGDWVLPRRIGIPWVDYPPLLYWAGCVSAKLLGGVSEFAFRLPSALAAILLALVTCAAASRLYGARAGLWAGVLLLTFTLFVYNAVAFRPDMLFALGVGAGTLLYAAGVGAIDEERSSWLLRVVGFALLGVAVLAKGPLGLLLPGLVLFLWHGFRREWKRLLSLAPLALVSLAVALPWYIAVANAMGTESLWREIYSQNFERWGEGVGYQGHIRPFHYYFVNVWADLAPWSLLLPFAVGWAIRDGRWRRPDVQLAVLWFGTWFAFLTLAATKRQLYLLPAYPAAALLLAPYVAALARRVAAPDPAPDEAPDPRPARVFSGGFAAVWLVAGVAAIVGGLGLMAWTGDRDLDPGSAEAIRNLRWPFVFAGVVALALAVQIGWVVRRSPVGVALTRVAASLVVTWVVLLAVLLPALNPARTYRPQGKWIRSRIGDAERIALLYPERGRNKAGAFAYYADVLVDLVLDEGDVLIFFGDHPDSLLLLHEDSAEAFFTSADPIWRKAVVRDLTAGRRRYLVLQLP